MTLSTGSRLGPYEVTGAIGAGGMGEVYLARDTNLGRDVAIKVLPDAFARDAARMARFSREAKLLAALNHPNIASIYGLETSGDTRALVMELAEGPTLADRISGAAPTPISPASAESKIAATRSGQRRPLPMEDVLHIARQMADALEYAHEHGIIHRDLKPANIKVAADDTVKILDFGLAKAMEADLTAEDIANSPTLSRMATEAGILLGTASYMSPEQAKAKPVDRRADIWAFGCVLYEMLTGKIAFRGETVTDTLAAVLTREPDLSQLPAATPMRVRVLLQRCFQKDPKQRLRDMGDARISLDEVLSGAPEAINTVATSLSVRRWRRALPWAAGVLAVAVAIMATWILKPAPGPAVAEPIRFQVPLPEKTALGLAGAFAVSPDGRQLAFITAGSDGVQRVWVRPLGSLEARPLPGTDLTTALPVIWSPDSRFIAFYSDGKLKKIPVSGGPAETVSEISSGVVVGGSWNRDGVIIFGNSIGALMQVSASGGSASPLTKIDPSRSERAHILPCFLSDGRHFLYLRVSSVPENSGMYVGSLDAKPEEQSSKLLLPTQYAPVYVLSSNRDSGYLLFLRERTLMAQPFDVRQLALVGEPTALAEGLGAFLNFGFFSASSSGVLAYRAVAGGSYQLTWYDRQGKVLDTVGEPTDLANSVRLSPDGTHTAFSHEDARGLPAAVWLLDLLRGTSERFTFGSAPALGAVWSPDGSRVIFASSREGAFDLYQKVASGATEEELLLKSPQTKYPDSWSRDGRFLLYAIVDPKTKYDLWVLPLGGGGKPFPFLSTQFNEEHGQFSPDGHWVAYASDESGRLEIYVRPFSPDSNGTASGTSGKWLISNGGGTDPLWRGDGRELYYIAANGGLMGVEVSTNPTFQAGVPKVLFQAPPLVTGEPYSQWDVNLDGKRFLFAAPAAQFEQAPFTVVLNWQAALKK